MGDFIRFIMGITFLMIFMGVLCGFMYWISMENQKAVCDKFNKEYNIKAEMDYHFQNYSPVCVIIVEDGSRILTSDFNMAAIKVPLSARR